MTRTEPVRTMLTACAVAAMVAAAAVPLSAQSPAPAAQQKTPPAAPSAGTQKPPIVLAEEALDQNRPKDAVKFAQQAVEQEPGGHAWFVLARAQQAAGDLDAAIDAGHRAATFASVRASAYYNLACAYASKGSREDAFKALTGAKRAGFADRDLMAKDRDLASLRGDARFVLPAERNYFTLKLKNGTELPFSVDLPVNYDPAKAYPVLVAPGQGRKIEGSWGGLFWGEDTSQRGWIAVESAALLTEDPMGTNAELFDEIARRYKVEGDRFHLLGYGPSSAAAFAVAITFPQRVKSLWVLPGFPVGAKDDGLARLKGVKVSFIVGDRDPYWYQESQAAHRKLQSLGVESYLEVVQGGGHMLQEMWGGEFAERLDNVR